jgi:hypothetical protein
MTTRNSNDQGIIFAASLVAGFGLIGLAWHFAAQDLIAPQNRLDMWALVQETWSYRRNFPAYLAWRWPPMISVGYPYAFTAAALAGVLLYGAVVAAQRQNWISLAQAAAGWAIGGVLGCLIMNWVPLPNILLTAFVMPGLAFLIGSLAPVLLAPPRDVAPVRGTQIKVSRGNSQATIGKAIKIGRTVLAGVMFDPPAENEHVAVFGTTGSGKTVALRSTMFTALSRGDRHVVADPDGGALSLFYQDGDVILNPADARSAKWDMLAEIEDDTDYRLLAEAVVPFPRDDRGSEWVMYAREVFATCLETWHRNQLGSSDAFFRAMATADTEKLAQLCEDTSAHRYFESGNEKMLGSVMGTLAPALGNMRQLGRLQGPAFSIRRWIREGKGSLWMPYQAKQIPALRGLISCWMGLAISETLSLQESKTRRIWFHVDELDALGRIQGLKDALARLRKMGGCVVLGLQSIAQVRGVYGEAEANTIIENCNNKLILRCGSSEGGGTARFASEVIGDRVVERDETTTSRSQGRNPSTSTTRAVREHREPAVMDSEIMQLDPCTGYLKVATQRHWLRVSFKPVDFSVRAAAFVPVEPSMREAAE